MIPALAAAWASSPQAVEEARASIDWDAAEAEAAAWLSELIQIDTVAPPGNEHDAAVFLERILRSEGFTTEIVEHGDNRSSLIARWSTGPTEKKPVCLLSHTDVVPSEPERWSRPPLSGAIEDGHVWGRGAIDMKGMGIMEVMAAALLARGGWTLDRDLIVLAVADEEVGGIGARAIVNDHWDDLDCGYVLNEGGLGQQDALFEGQDVHAISVAERGVLWLRLVAEGAPGHGSTIEDGEAPQRLVDAMQRVAKKYKPKTTLTPETVELLERLGEHKGGIVGTILKSGLGRSLIVKGQLESSNPSMVQTTVHLTGMSGASSTNVVPSTVWASYDCRTLPGVEPRDLLAELEAITEGMEGVHWEVLDEVSGNGNTWEDPFFDTLAHYAVEGDPKAVAAPILSPGFTDSIFVRPTGALAYGYIPISITGEERARMHGDDERISLENLRRGIRVIFSTVLGFSGTGGLFAEDLRGKLAAVGPILDASRAAEGLAMLQALRERETEPARVGLVEAALTKHRAAIVDSAPALLSGAMDAEDWASCRVVAEVLVEGGSADIGHAQAARCAALEGDADAAFEHLAFALENGLTLDDLEQDGDLADLRDDPRWSELRQ